MGSYATWNRLTTSEKWFLLTHPTLIGTIRDDANKALAEAARRFPSGLHNGPGDAFRHCFWSALLTRDVGSANAKAYTDAHESYAANPPKEKAMDLHNNAAGIRIGLANLRAADVKLATECSSALRSGRLRTTP